MGSPDARPAGPAPARADARTQARLAGPGASPGDAEARDRSGLGIAAVVCAGAAIVAWGVYGGLLLAVAAIVLGVLAMRDPRTSDAGRTMAIVGLVLGIVEAAFSLLALLFFLACCMSWPGSRRSSGTCGDCGDCGCKGCDCCDGCADCGCKGCGDCGCGDCGCGDCGCGDCGCGECGDCGCQGCDCGCQGCDCGCEGCDCGPGCATVNVLGVAVPGRGRVATLARMRRHADHWLAHHPDLPQTRADVYRVAGIRLCVGCFTTYPAFLLASAWLAVAPVAPGLALWLGAGLACAQGVSTLGWTKWRPLKVAVKASLGTGMALLVHGILASAWHERLQAAALLGLVALAGVSALPRKRRLEALTRAADPNNP